MAQCRGRESPTELLAYKRTARVPQADSQELRTAASRNNCTCTSARPRCQLPLASSHAGLRLISVVPTPPRVQRLQPHIRLVLECESRYVCWIVILRGTAQQKLSEN